LAVAPRSCKIDQLPDEVLAQIFRAVTFRGWLWFPKYRAHLPHPSELEKPLLVKELHSVLLVCRRWNGVVNAAGRLSNMELILDHRLSTGHGAFRNKAQFLACIRRVVKKLGSGSLHLAISFPPHLWIDIQNSSENWVEHGIRLLQPVTRQISTLKLIQRSETIYANLSTMARLGPLGRLEELDIHDPMRQDLRVIRSLEGRSKIDLSSSAPYLGILRVTGINVVNIIILPPQLHELTMPVILHDDGDWILLLAFLSSIPCLKEVDLTVMSTDLNLLELNVPDTKLSCSFDRLKLSLPERVAEALLLAMDTTQVSKLQLSLDTEGVILNRAAKLPIFPIADSVNISFHRWGTFLDELLTNSFPRRVGCLRMAFMPNASLTMDLMDPPGSIEIPQIGNLTLNVHGDQPSWMKIVSRWSIGSCHTASITPWDSVSLPDSREPNYQSLKLPFLEYLRIGDFRSQDMHGILAFIEAPTVRSMSFVTSSALPDLTRPRITLPPVLKIAPAIEIHLISVEPAIDKRLLRLFPLAEEVTFIFTLDERKSGQCVDALSKSLCGVIKELKSRGRPSPYLRRVTFQCLMDTMPAHLKRLDAVKGAITSVNNWRSSRKPSLPMIHGTLLRQRKDIFWREVVWAAE
jgi:hypothetical protein